MSQSESYRTIVRSSSISGLASLATIASGLIKLKVLALVLGPVGVGLFGIYQNLMQAAATLATLGQDTVGTRAIAESSTRDDASSLPALLRSFWRLTFGLAIAGGLIACGLAPFVARWWGLPIYDLFWLGLGVAASVAAAGYLAALTGLRRIATFARVQIWAALISAAAGVLAVLLMGTGGLIVMIVAAPVLTLTFAWLAGRRAVAELDATPQPIASSRDYWTRIGKAGVPVMLAAAITTAGPLAVRALVQGYLGAAAAGQFQAAWAVGMTYLGFILGAMATDFYPRLSAATGDDPASVRLVNEQTEVALLLCAPVIVVLIGAADYLVPLLYASAFAPAADVLRWQLLGDILKVVSWPLGFLMLASGANRSFMLAELAGMSVFVTVVAAGLAPLGVSATGIAFLAMYALYLPLVWWLARRRHGFRWSPSVIKLALSLATAASAVLAIVVQWPTAGAVLGAIVGGMFGLFALRQLSQKVGWPSKRGIADDR